MLACMASWYRLEMRAKVSSHGADIMFGKAAFGSALIVHIMLCSWGEPGPGGTLPHHEQYTPAPERMLFFSGRMHYYPGRLSAW
jgi:hypothetical protein